MRIRLHGYAPFAAFCLSLLLALACASEGSLNGGDKDVEPPRLVKTYPPNGTLNFIDNEVVFYFNEYIRPGSYASEVFVSPVQEKKPTVETGLRKIRVKLNDQLKPNTTYVITLGTGVKDYTEGNKLANSITIAFSTGSILDSMMVSGKVVNPQTGAGEDGYTVMLFPANELGSDSIFGKRPKYATQTDESGRFRLSYLSRQNYRVYAVKDGDRNFMYNQLKEKVALASDPLIVFPDTAEGANVSLQSTVIDKEAPFPRSAKWVNDFTVVVDFREKIPLSIRKDSLQIYMTDTSGSDPQKVRFFNRIPGDETKMFLSASRAKENPSRIHFRHLTDTLGNQIDTFINIDPEKYTKDYDGKVVLSPEFDAQTLRYRFPFVRPLRPFLNGRLVEVTDTLSKKLVPYSYQNHDFYMDVSVKDLPEKASLLKIEFFDGIQFRRGDPTDSLYKHYQKLIGAEEVGQLQGTVIDTALPGNWIVFLKNDKGKTVRTSGKEFTFKNLPAGNYSFWMFEDRDSNGVYTPGNLFPYRLPEKVFVDESPVEVRAKWEVEGHQVIVKKSFKPISASSSGSDPKKKSPGGAGPGKAAGTKVK